MTPPRALAAFWVRLRPVLELPWLRRARLLPRSGPGLRGVGALRGAGYVCSATVVRPVATSNS